MGLIMVVHNPVPEDLKQGKPPNPLKPIPLSVQSILLKRHLEKLRQTSKKDS